MSRNKESQSCNINDKSCLSSSAKSKPAEDLKSHWDNVYKKTELEKLGWYEENPEPSLKLIKKCNLNEDASILNIGAGATTLLDELLMRGFKNIIANDLSSIALDKLKARLNKDDNKKVRWIVDDLTHPSKLNHLGPIDLWHDRAVLHFFIDTREQDTYFELLKKLVKLNGYVIIATFNLNGATMCSGLPVKRYDSLGLKKELGNDFQLIETFDFTYLMPSGDSREYVYTLFERIN